MIRSSSVRHGARIFKRQRSRVVVAQVAETFSRCRSRADRRAQTAFFFVERLQTRHRLIDFADLSWHWCSDDQFQSQRSALSRRLRSALFCSGVIASNLRFCRARSLNYATTIAANRSPGKIEAMLSGLCWLVRQVERPDSVFVSLGICFEKRFQSNFVELEILNVRGYVNISGLGFAKRHYLRLVICQPIWRVTR